MVMADATWLPDASLLVSRLSGTAFVTDVERWQAALADALDTIPANSAFKFLSDMHGYEFGELAAHKAMRTVIPTTLAQYGHRTALLDLFDPVELPLTSTRGITCSAVAHVHHDAEKMAEYERTLGRANERFFATREAAHAWLQSMA